MVKKYDIHGTLYHEPPYTEEEILEGARRSNGGVVAFSSLRHPRKPVPAINKDNDKEPTRG
ncbi:hypothetical protein [Altererythrobacter rubellus]|uniref:Uncharacterized protein n=1 Tax=Altererythrobacter rubellus TaxID=2173831 RepID=A0A9Y2B8V1_9SPHN|nr:hypothetical protein [Altererythrobacter rubellus]WIW95458.1 hypothetical protein QQX03_11065 [Altererythrobacter rubellus]